MSGESVYDACLEERPDGSLVAQILDLPGCYGTGSSADEALRVLVASIPAYYNWLRRHDDYTPVVEGPFRASVVERQRSGALFAHDGLALTSEDLDWHLALLRWAFTDLTAVVAAFPAGALDRVALYGRPAREALARSLERSLAILACLDGQPTPPIVSDDPAAFLESVGSAWDASMHRLEAMSDADRSRVFDCDGEQWTARKLLRRGTLLLREQTATLAQAG